MPGLGQIALNSAPIFGGAMLAIAAGQFKGPDFRALIRQDMDLLDRLPADATKRRANLQRTIDARIDDLIDAADKSHALRKAAMSYWGNWRHRATCLRAVVHDHLVECQSRPGQLVADLCPVDPVGGGDCRLRTTRRVTRCHLTHARPARCRPVASTPRRDCQTTALPAPRRRRCPGDADGRRCMVCASYADTHHRKDAQRCNQARSIQ